MGFKFTRDTRCFTVAVPALTLAGRYEIPASTEHVYAPTAESAVDDFVQTVAVRAALPPWRPLKRALRARARVVSSMIEVVKL